MIPNSTCPRGSKNNGLFDRGKILITFLKNKKWDFKIQSENIKFKLLFLNCGIGGSEIWKLKDYIVM